MKILSVVGARPNFMKIAPICAAFRDAGRARHVLVHTGQHYDYQMNQAFFEQLGIPAPDHALDVGSGSHAVQTAEIMKRIEPVLLSEMPDCVLVVGDVNSTLACALVASKLGIPVVHVEAGLRSGDRAMPEEINRIVTDQLSDRLYVTEAGAIANLEREGVGAEKIVFAGNVMIDTLFACIDSAVDPAETIAKAMAGADDAGARWSKSLAAAEGKFTLLTLHRPSNVDHADTLRRILEAVDELRAFGPIVFPVHPRTRVKLAEAGLDKVLSGAGWFVLPPVGYLELVGFMKAASLVMTDSGGIQEETTALSIPCLTLRESTERPVTVEVGTNRIVGTDGNAIRTQGAAALAGGMRAGERPLLWDGAAARRIESDLLAWLARGGPGSRPEIAR